MRERWQDWKAKHWDESFREGAPGGSFWEGGNKVAPPLRRAARWLTSRFAGARMIEWLGLLMAVVWLIRCS